MFAPADLIRIPFLAVFLVVLSLLPTEAAIIYLKDGGQLKGTIVGATARDVEIHTTDGTLRITSDRIMRIDYSELETPPATTPSLPTGSSALDPWRNQRRNQDEGRQMFSLNLGFASPISEVDFSSTGGGHADNGNTGVQLGTQYVYFVNPRLGTGFNFEYMNRAGSDTTSLLPNSETRVSGDSLLLLAVARFTIVNRGVSRPYILVGLGANRTSTVIDAQPLVGFEWSDTATDETRRLVDGSKWGVASSLRFGIDFWAMEPSFFSLELGWTGISNGKIDASQQGKDLGLTDVTGRLNVINVTGRWNWRF